jgi:hypothetical protein
MMRKETYWTRSPLMHMMWKKVKRYQQCQNKVEDLIQHAKSSKEGMYFLVSSIMNIEASRLHIVPTTLQIR